VKLLVLLAFLLAPEEPCTVSGKVVDAVTGAPLGKVQLRLEQIGENDTLISATTSDSEGKFALAGMEPGSYRLKGMRSGYLETWYGAKRADAAGTPLRLDGGQLVDGLTLRMIPAGVIAGTIRDRDGDPVAGVNVRLWGWKYHQEQNLRFLNSFEDARTDDLGQYRFANLAANKYYVQATPPHIRNVVDRSFGKDRRLEVDVTTYYPGTQEAGGATQVQVTPGAKFTSTDITLVRARVFKVRGFAVSEPGVPEPAQVQLLTGKPDVEIWEAGYWTQVKNGEFEFAAVPPGSYTLAATDRPSGSSHFQGTGHLDVGSADVEGVRIVIGGGTEIVGSLALDGGDKISRQDCVLDFIGDPLRGRPADLRNDGSFYARLYPGSYSLQFQNDRDPSLFLKSVKLDGVEIVDQKLTIGAPGKLRLEIILSRDSGTVEGTTEAGATVILTPLNLPATADQNGRFEFKGVPPGDYRILAFDDIEPGAWLDADFWKGRETQGEPVTVRAKEKAVARVQMSKPASR
jgi:5-hydroxyisourate hydrolase-like protein (transthyretin family)